MAPKSNDARFARLQTDPRFRRPKQKNVKVEIDDRFKDVLQSEEFGGKGKGKGKGKAKAGDGAKVDKRGRPINASHQADQLKRFYRMKSPSPEKEGFVDYARGEGNLSSSGSEDESEADEESEVEEEELELGGKKLNRLPQHALSDDDSESESDADGSHLDIDLSETEETPVQADEGEGDEDEQPSIPPTKRIAAVNLDWDNLRAADLFSVFNSFLNMQSRKGESSTSSLGRVTDVKIYPSQFGKERMEKEEQEGPGGGIFVGNAGKSKKKQGIVLDSDSGSDEDDEETEVEDEGDSEEDDLDDEDLEEIDEDDLPELGSEEELELGSDEEGLHDDDQLPTKSHAQEIDGLEVVSDVSSEADEGDIDMDKLRQYQLERLRYYYAIATFSSVAAAEHVMTECNGTEFERTANMFDLSYVPDEMDFSTDEPKDEATKEIKGYKGNDFVTDALRHSKVKLTWDQDDPNRAKMTRRTLTRQEIDEQDFNNLVASSGSEDERSEEDGKAVGTAPSGSKKSKKDRSKDLRALLFNNDDEDDDVWGKAGTAWKEELAEVRGEGKGKSNGDMEITFKPALSGSKILGGADEENMTTLERYQMRMKEKKARKKEKRELRRAGKLDGSEDDDDDVDHRARPAKGQADDFFGDSSGEDDHDDKEEEEEPPAPPKTKRGSAKKRASPSSAPAPVPAKDDLPADLQTATDHFSMKDIMRAEKEKGKRKRRRTKKGKHEDERELELGPDGWKIDTKDDRFKVLHEEPEFAIDPSNPAFTKTQGMKDLLAERARIRAQKPLHEPVGKRVFKQDDAPAEKDLSSLVNSVKRKMDGQQKTRKRSRK